MFPGTVTMLDLHCRFTTGFCDCDADWWNMLLLCWSRHQ